MVESTRAHHSQGMLILGGVAGYNMFSLLSRFPHIFIDLKTRCGVEPREPYLPFLLLEIIGPARTERSVKEIIGTLVSSTAQGKLGISVQDRGT